jgi:hypothetical protein
MHRLARYLFTLCAVASLLLCVAVCGLWARSHRRADVVGWKPNYEVCSIQSYCGKLFVFANLAGSGDPGERDWFGCKSAPVEDVSEYYDMIEYAARWQGPGGFSSIRLPRGLRILIVPHWAAAAAAMLLPATWVARQINRRRRVRRGHCPTCGYDLRASPERCPECGGSGFG